jgi:ribonuclease R
MKKSKKQRRESPDDKSPEPHKGPTKGLHKPEKNKDNHWRARDPDAESEAARYAHPLPSRTLIHQTIADAAEAPSLDDLIGQFGLKKLNEQEALAKRLVAMTRDNQLQQDKRGRYWAV